MRQIFNGSLAFVGLLICLLLGADEQTADQATNLSPRQWIKLTFGLDEKVADWDGSVSIEGGKIRQIDKWGFERDHHLDADAHKWTCSTFVNNRRELSTYAEPFRGIILDLELHRAASLYVKTEQGNFAFNVSELIAGHPTKFLNARASAELLTGSEPLLGQGSPRPQLSDTPSDDDFPTLTVDDRGHRWVAWITYNQELSQDELYALDLDEPPAEMIQLEAGRFQASPLLLTGVDGYPWLFWCGAQNGNWEIYASRLAEGRATTPERITTAEGTDFHLAGARGPEGELWLAWQSFRNGNGDVYAKRWHNGRWSADILLTDQPSNQWEPSIGVDARGRAWIAYDSYQNGNYDVYLTSVSLDANLQAQRGDTIAVATSGDFEAHASVEATGEKIWVAYDAAGPNWGKDVAGSNTTYRGKYADPIHANRRIELRAFEEGKVLQPKKAFPQKLDTLRPKSVAHRYMGEVRRFYDLPQLARDEKGQLWVLFRLNRQGYAEDPETAMWEIYATSFVDGEWLEPILLPHSWGRQNQRIATATVKKGASKNVPAGLYCVWSRGHHMIDAPQQVRVGSLPDIKGDVTDPPVEATSIEPPAAKVASKKPLAPWTMQRDGRTLRVFFGDLHRHTDISWCYPTVDGCLVDAYRYAMDAAGLDFLAITDHTRDTDPYPWWNTQKANDLFHVPGTFTPIYGYERSNTPAGGGHRNVFFVERDWPVYRSEHHYMHTDQDPGERLDPPAALYPNLRGKAAFTAAHTPKYERRAMSGTWSYNDPIAEPLVEIFQGFRISSERPSKSVVEEASVWHALKKGYRLGFIASSDHVSTHMSYACVWAEGQSRAQLFEAMQARRTYAATDKILLDVRIGEAVMGEETSLEGKPELSIHVRGTDLIDELQIIRNAKVIYESSPGVRDVRTTFRDENYNGGNAWYYVRIRQTDDAMAWGSPIWVN
jgi:hypothetical protein